MPTRVTQLNANNSQSTLQIDLRKIFIRNNRYDRSEYTNGSGDSVTWQAGEFVARNASDNKIVKVTSSNLANVIGIVTTEYDVAVPDTESRNFNFCISGEVDSQYLTLPDGVTFATAVGNVTFRDVVQGRGIKLTAGTDNTIYDNT